MDFGASMFFTDYSMTSGGTRPGAGGSAASNSSGRRSTRTFPPRAASPFPGGGDLPKQYYDAMDPFVTLTAAAMATKTLKVGTGVCLVNQRDPIQTAKLVASIDQVSGGRFLFGIGVGWNDEEMEDHGTVFATRAKLVRERVEAMKAIWTKSKAEYHGEFVNFARDDGLAEAGAEAASAGHRRRRLPAGGAARGPLRRRLDPAGRPRRHPRPRMPKFREMLKEAGRDDASCPITLFGCADDADTLKRYRDLGVVRACVSLPAAKADAGAADPRQMGGTDPSGQRLNHCDDRKGTDDAFRRVDVLHRLFDDGRRTGPGAGGARLRIRLGGGALAHPDLAALAVGRRRRSAEAVLRRDGSVRDPDRRGGGDQDAEARHRRLPGEPARHDPDREAGGLDRPGVRRALPVRHRHRLERRGDGGPRHGVRHARQAGARAGRGDEGDLDQERRRSTTASWSTSPR